MPCGQWLLRHSTYTEGKWHYKKPRRIASGGFCVGCVNLQNQGISTRWRNSLPGLKCGTCLSGTITELPVLGLRPTRA